LWTRRCSSSCTMTSSRNLGSDSARSSARVCPCGSGAIIADCCLTRRARTTPAPPRSGFAHSRCYARELCDRSHQISREHPLSESVLRVQNPSGLVDVTNWTGPGETLTLTTKQIVLCTRHNQALSDLDALAQRVFSFLLEPIPSSALLLVNGADLERWLLKRLLGLAASRAAEYRAAPEDLEVLFGERPLEQQAGLHVIEAQSYRARVRRHHLQLIANSSTGRFEALLYACTGFLLLFSTKPIPPANPITRATTRHRPRLINVTDADDRVRELHLGWRDGPPVFLHRGQRYRNHGLK
jgi:hypothetical protein